MAWLLHRAPDIVPIPGTTSPAHLRQNLEALKLELCDAELTALDG